MQFGCGEIVGGVGRIKGSFWQRSLSCVEVQPDNKTIVETLKGEVDIWSYGKGLVGQIRNMITGDKMVSFVHIYREANAYANAMAKMSLSLESDTIVYNTYLKDIVQLISSDTIGTSFLCIVFS